MKDANYLTTLNIDISARVALSVSRDITSVFRDMNIG